MCAKDLAPSGKRSTDIRVGPIVIKRTHLSKQAVKLNFFCFLSRSLAIDHHKRKRKNWFVLYVHRTIYMGGNPLACVRKMCAWLSYTSAMIDPNSTCLLKPPRGKPKTINLKSGNPCGRSTQLLLFFSFFFGLEKEKDKMKEKAKKKRQTEATTCRQPHSKVSLRLCWI